MASRTSRWEENQESSGKLGCPSEEAEELVWEVFVSVRRKDG